MAAPAAAVRPVRPLRPRDPAERGRVASPLQWLTDLCFVVAVGQAAEALQDGLGHAGPAVLGYLMAFFSIWWAWLNFSWFSSAYDNDEVGFRLLTILQIVGVLTLAGGITVLEAGVEEGSGHFGLVVVGYVIMRVGELVVPAWAERTGRTPWHPHHIAERYGLFFLIVLGETILAATLAVQEAFTGPGEHRVALASVTLGGVLVVFGLWWLYFSRGRRGPGACAARRHARGVPVRVRALRDLRRRHGAGGGAAAGHVGGAPAPARPVVADRAAVLRGGRARARGHPAGLLGAARQGLLAVLVVVETRLAAADTPAPPRG